MNKEIIELVGITEGTDDYGETTRVETKRTVYAKLSSMDFSLVMEAQSKGFKPSFKFILTDYYDYQGESELIFEGRRYTIGYTQRTGEGLTIVCGAGVDVIAN